MKAFLQSFFAYFVYLAKHKWFVFVAGVKATKAPLWRLVIHDWSKFTPAEFGPYRRKFFGETYPTAVEAEALNAKLATFSPFRFKMTKEMAEAAFHRAWLHHIHLNPHHPQHWLLHLSDPPDGIGLRPLEMPEPIVREMVADWMGAGRAQHGKWDVHSWYAKNRDKMVMHPNTRKLVDKVLEEIGYVCQDGSSRIYRIDESYVESGMTTAEIDEDEATHGAGRNRTAEASTGNVTSEGAALSIVARPEDCLSDAGQEEDAVRGVESAGGQNPVG